MRRGSGRTTKRCCGARRGPSEADLARAFLAGQVRPAARVLRGCSDDKWEDLQAEMLELPTIDTSLQLPLPRLLTPLRERGRIEPKVAAVALIELSDPRLQRLVSSAVVQAAGSVVGDVATPAGC